MAARKESVVGACTDIPWPTSVALAILVFITVRAIVPRLPIDEPLLPRNDENSGPLGSRWASRFSRFSGAAALERVLPRCVS